MFVVAAVVVVVVGGSVGAGVGGSVGAGVVGQLPHVFTHRAAKISLSHNLVAKILLHE